MPGTADWRASIDLFGAGTQPAERVHPNVVQISMLDVEVREVRIVIQGQFQDNKIPKAPVDVQYTTV